jgi:hypothetical protein
VQLTEGNEYWKGPEHIAQHLLGVWFAAAHQPWMNLDFIMLQLCSHPDIQDTLRTELGDFKSLTYDRLQNLPFLDSFIKEVVRLRPLDTCKLSCAKRWVCANPASGCTEKGDERLHV